MLAIISAPISAMLSQGAVIASLAAADERGPARDRRRSRPSARCPTSVGIENGNPQARLDPASTALPCPIGEQVTITRVSRTSPTHSDRLPDERRLQEGRRHHHADSDRQCSRRRRPTSPRPRRRPTPARRGSRSSARSSTRSRPRAPGCEREPHRRPGHPAGQEPHRHDGRRGTVLFPALTASPPAPGYTLVTTLSGYNVFPDDLARSCVVDPVDAGLNSTGSSACTSHVADGERPEFGRRGLDEPERPLARLVALRRADGGHPSRPELGHVHHVPLRDGDDGSCRCRRTCSARCRSSTSTTSRPGRPPARQLEPGYGRERSVELSDDADAEREREDSRRRPVQRDHEGDAETSR